MLARTMIALVTSPFYGLLITLITIPLMVVFAVVVAVASTGSVAIAAVLAGLSVLFQAVLYAQSARYAVAMTRLLRLADQTDFFTAVGRCLLITIIVGILSGLITLAFFLVAVQFGGAQEWWWMDREKLIPAITTAMNSPARAEEIFSFENMNIGSLMFVIEAISMFFITVIALFAVPRSAGVGPGHHRAYTPGLILTRFLIALPALALVSWGLSGVAVKLIELAAGAAIESVALTASLRYLFEIVLYTGMIFSLEAVLLKTAREHSGDEEALERQAEYGEAADFRALRDSWTQRN